MERAKLETEGPEGGCDNSPDEKSQGLTWRGVHGDGRNRVLLQVALAEVLSLLVDPGARTVPLRQKPRPLPEVEVLSRRAALAKGHLRPPQPPLPRDQRKGSLGQCAPARRAAAAALRDSLQEQGLPRATPEASGPLGPFRYF